jgi:hypothetical protein
MSRRSKSQNSGSTVNTEVSHLFNLKNKQQFTNALLSLRNKYKDDDLVNKIQDVFTEKHSKIVRGAKKFAEAVRKRYSSSDIPFHLLLAKARAHAHKHHLSESEFAEFQRMYEQELSGTNQRNEVVLPVTNMMKVLGNITSGMDSHFKVDEKDYRYLQEVLKLNEMSRPLHAQAILQSLQYNDLDNVALTGTIAIDKHNPGEHVHPIVAAMFLPKIDIFESHFLYSNISGIVKSRYNQQPLTTRPDYELFYNLVTDPNDIVCDSNTPISDLLNRCNLQNHLWNAVLHLRNGQAYNSSFREFINAIDICRLNKYDNPDLIYGRHDGTVIKRLVSAFSFRPTVITTIPISNVFASNPYAQNVRPTVTSIPMINVRLQQYQYEPSSLFTGAAPSKMGPIKLSKCMSQPQTFIEGNILVQRISDVIYSREVLIFYVDRRGNILQYDVPFNLSRLPTAVAGFERINDFEIDLECSMELKNDKFCLRSVVVAETQQQTDSNDTRKLVVGSSSYIFDYEYIMANGKATSIKSCSTINTTILSNKLLTEAPLVAFAASNPGKALVAAIGVAKGDASKISGVQTAIDDIMKDVTITSDVKKYFNNFIIPGACGNAIKLVHYNPANALKQKTYVCYDSITNNAFNTTATATGLTTTLGETQSKIAKQGVVFIYQNFAYAKNDNTSFQW